MTGLTCSICKLPLGRKGPSDRAFFWCSSCDEAVIVPVIPGKPKPEKEHGT